MKNQTHIVNKISIQLTLPTTDDQLQHSEQVKTAVQGAVEKLNLMLDEDFEASFYQVGKLLVELSLPEEKLSQLEKRLREILTEKLLAAVTQGESSNHSRIVQIEEQSPEDRWEEMLLYFLQTGRFPWWADINSLQKLEEKWLKSLSFHKWLEIIQPLYKKDETVINRFARQFSDSIIANLIKHSTNEEVDVYIDLINKISSGLDLPFGGVRKLKITLHQIALTSLVSQEVEANAYRMLTKAFITEFLKVHTDIDELASQWKLCLKEKTKSEIDKLLQIIVGNSESGELNRLYKKYQNSDDETAFEALLKAVNKWSKNESRLTSETKNKRIRADDKTSTYNEETDIEEYAVENAGLVLLNPFLERLFENLAFIEAGEFVSDEIQERAACLLHYLATGEEKFEEQTLILPKFLCHLPFRKPIDRFLPINDYEKEECANVLQSTIKHWSALNNTSTEGLQANFIQRPGSLKNEVFGWCLYVEQKTPDILLDKLPWELSIVKLKWMDELLTVKW